MLGNSSQHPEFGHFTLECALNSSFHWFIRESWTEKKAKLLTCSYPDSKLPKPNEPFNLKSRASIQAMLQIYAVDYQHSPLGPYNHQM